MEFINHEFMDTREWTLDTPVNNPRNCHFYEKHGYVKVKDEGELRYYKRCLE